MELKKCTTCAEEKPRDAFYKKSSGSMGLASRCKACVSDYGKKQYARPEVVEQKRWQWVQKQYGLTKAAFTAMWEASGGCCTICSTPLRITHAGYAIDHNHTTGEVRGLLCSTCNAGLGQFKDSPSRLRAAAAYLERVGTYEQPAGST